MKKLEEVAEIIMGTSPPGNTYNHDGVGLPLLNGPTEFGSVYPESTLYTTGSKKECKPGDLIFCVRGNTTGRMNWADKQYSIGRGVCAIRGKTNIDTKYIKMCLEVYLPVLLQLASGATMPNLTQNSIRQFVIPYPGYLNKIAAILSAYDDLIENNLRRIKILEEMAQNLYREWFVNFRFPGHENTRFVDSPLGEIPEGWEVSSLGAVSEIITGYAFKSKDWSDMGVPVIKIKNIRPGNSIDTDQVDYIPEYLLDSIHDRYILSNGDILIAMTGATAGKIGKIRCKSHYLLNQRVAKIKPLLRYKEYIWCRLTAYNAEKEFYSLADGAAQPNMSGSQIEAYQVIIPTEDLNIAFVDIVQPIIDQVDNLYMKNNTLRQTRDLLLPKLISGEVDVSDLDINLPEEALV